MTRKSGTLSAAHLPMSVHPPLPGKDQPVHPLSAVFCDNGGEMMLIGLGDVPFGRAGGGDAGMTNNDVVGRSMLRTG